MLLFRNIAMTFPMCHVVIDINHKRAITKNIWIYLAAVFTVVKLLKFLRMSYISQLQSLMLRSLWFILKNAPFISSPQKKTPSDGISSLKTTPKAGASLLPSLKDCPPPGGLSPWSSDFTPLCSKPVVQWIYKSGVGSLLGLCRSSEISILCSFSNEIRIIDHLTDILILLIRQQGWLYTGKIRFRISFLVQKLCFHKVAFIQKKWFTL